VTDNIIRVPRVTRTGPFSALSIWPPDETGIATTVFHSLARPIQGDEPMKTTRKVRPNLTAEEKDRLAKYGSIEFKSAGATRKRGGSVNPPITKEITEVPG
jgi:hypothetical protein